VTAVAHTPVRAWDRWADRIAGSDPGLNRLRMAVRSMLVIGVILGAEWLFVHFTHALQIQAHGARLPAAQAAEVAAANHPYLVIALLIGAIVGILSSFGVTDPTARGQLVTTLFLPVPMIAGLALGLALGGYRIPALASFAVILAVGTYFRRFGPQGFIGGIVLFLGDFLGFFLHAAITLGDLGWVAAEIGVGLAVTVAVRFVLFYPRRARDLERIKRSYAARARKVAALALDLLDTPGQTGRDVRRLHRQLARLNEAALMIDAQLGDPGAVADGSSAQLLHQCLFDAGLALTNIARFAQAMARTGLPAPWHFEARLALRDIVRGENQTARTHAARLTGLLRQAGPVPDGADRRAVVVVYRFAGSVTALADAMTGWMAVGAANEGQGAFQPSVQLFDGWLPGSATVSNAASLEPGRRPGDRVRLALYTRTAIQMGVAAGVAIALGDLLSGRQFYLAVIAAFVAFMGANNSGEQVRKAFFRVAGVAVGSLLVSVVGHHTGWSVAVILGALFFGFYLMRINYTFVVIGVTVLVSQLYVHLGEFSDSLLLRLEETALGAAVAIVVVMLVLPLRTPRVLHIAVRDQVQAVGRLAGHALRLATAARHYSRNLVTDTAAAGPLDPGTRVDIELASATLRHSLDVIAAALTGPRDAVYTRSAALFDAAERRLEEHSGTAGPAQLAIRGRVRGPDGAGIRAAVTLIDPRGLQAALAAAGPDGAYWLDAPAPGAYVLLASAASHQPAASTVIVPQRPDGGSVVNVLLAAAGNRLTSTVAVAAGTLRIAGGEGTIRHDIELNHPRADVHPKQRGAGPGTPGTAGEAG
jgi:uncharacterized membrane protein YgaE (UPF0421/DUF939 family)